MKRLAVLLVAGALVALMLQPVSPTVNRPPGNGDSRADGAYPPRFPGQPLPDGTASGGWLS